jgi:hypothetical protein
MVPSRFSVAPRTRQGEMFAPNAARSVHPQLNVSSATMANRIKRNLADVKSETIQWVVERRARHILTMGGDVGSRGLPAPMGAIAEVATMQALASISPAHHRGSHGRIYRDGQVRLVDIASPRGELEKRKKPWKMQSSALAVAVRLD